MTKEQLDALDLQDLPITHIFTHEDTIRVVYVTGEEEIHIVR